MDLIKINHQLHETLEENNKLYHLLKILDVPDGYEYDFKELINYAEKVNDILVDILSN